MTRPGPGCFALALTAWLALTGCAGTPAHEPIRTVEHVDLERFMGDWYVIANIPTFIEKGAHNAVESYRLDEDGSIATTFTFRQDAFDGKQKTYHPRGFVEDTRSNAVWGMRFIWPFKADYRIIYLDDAYRLTVIGRQKRDFAWIMARSPSIPDAEYRHMLELLDGQGYDISRVEKVPQRWQ